MSFNHTLMSNIKDVPAKICGLSQIFSHRQVIVSCYQWCSAQSSTIKCCVTVVCRAVWSYVGSRSTMQRNEKLCIGLCGSMYCYVVLHKVLYGNLLHYVWFYMAHVRFRGTLYIGQWNVLRPIRAIPAINGYTLRRSQ